jgi:hypothetical protein
VNCPHNFLKKNVAERENALDMRVTSAKVANAARAGKRRATSAVREVVADAFMMAR